MQESIPLGSCLQSMLNLQSFFEPLGRTESYRRNHLDLCYVLKHENTKSLYSNKGLSDPNCYPLLEKSWEFALTLFFFWKRRAFLHFDNEKLMLFVTKEVFNARKKSLLKKASLVFAFYVRNIMHIFPPFPFTCAKKEKKKNISYLIF